MLRWARQTVSFFDRFLTVCARTLTLLVGFPALLTGFLPSMGGHDSITLTAIADRPAIARWLVLAGEGGLRIGRVPRLRCPATVPGAATSTAAHGAAVAPARPTPAGAPSQGKPQRPPSPPPPPPGRGEERQRRGGRALAEGPGYGDGSPLRFDKPPAVATAPSQGGTRPRPARLRRFALRRPRKSGKSGRPQPPKAGLSLFFCHHVRSSSAAFLRAGGRPQCPVSGLSGRFWPKNRKTDDFFLASLG